MRRPRSREEQVPRLGFKRTYAAARIKMCHGRSSQLKHAVDRSQSKEAAAKGETPWRNKSILSLFPKPINGQESCLPHDLNKRRQKMCQMFKQHLAPSVGLWRQIPDAWWGGYPEVKQRMQDCGGNNQRQK
ncbi:hypothetical protein E3N88_44357 [Mikania micrantha]|uniref:Uncharacterized protein n=1 Tax=Mikania micrantha TaxID=192012 RepID=A0A5N6LC96_9ASTR|nr:hypothetical protein E3N88_44357 [Mikania micrantha]